LISTRETRFTGVHATVHSHDASTSKPKVMLESMSDVIYLSFLCHSSELPTEFSALGKTSSTERMSLRDESTTGVYYNTTTIGEFVVIDGLSSSTNGAKSNSLISTKLISRETVM